MKFPLCVSDLRRALDRRDFSATELCREALARIRAADPILNSFITIDEEGALRAAEAADHRLQQHKSVPPLTGIPIAHKDVFCTRGVRTTCASKMLEDFTPPYDATIVERTAAAGAVCLGKTNMDEFAMGSSNRTSYFGPVRNPWNLSRVPGGSSGGMAAAVAADLVPLATGSDTGGSIRQPAAFCGVSGLRPTYGRVSRHGMVAYASSLDQCGPCARSIEDLGLLLAAMEGPDPLDSTCSVRQETGLNEDWGPRTIGIPDIFISRVEPDVWDPIGHAKNVFEKLGYRIKKVDLPHFDIAMAAYMLISTAEASSNLARFDGVRFGHRASGAKDIASLYQHSRADGFGREVKRRILVGTYALASDHREHWLTQAQRVRRLVLRDFQSAFSEVDLIFTPTTPTVALKLDDPPSGPAHMYNADAFTVPSALAGLPALTMPCGFVGGLPMGAQLTAKPFHEGELLSAGRAFQRETDWHRRVPEPPNS